MLARNESVELLKQAKNHAVSILTGSRQVGKSTLMRMLRDELALASEYYDLENPRHLALFEEGYTSFMRQNRGKLVFIDEFQYCKNISSVFKAVYDLAPEIKIYASGSSSFEIQAHLKESLAGRKLERVIYPLSFSEWLTQFRPAGLRADQGAIKEQFAFRELKKSIDIRYSLYYWRTTSGNEVDFVLEKDREYLPIEVKSPWLSGKTPPGIRHFFDYYPETRAAVVLYDGPEVSRTEDGRRLFFLPLYKACRIPGLL